MKKSIYMDYAAATPMDSQVLKTMRPYFVDHFYNPSSAYQAAKKVKQAIDDARFRVAHWLGAKPAEIIFTAGATESINLAIFGVMQKWPQGNVLVSAIEHDAVLGAAKNFDHSIVLVGNDGLVDLSKLKNHINDNTVLISVGLANNEIGVVQPIKEIAAIIKSELKVRRLRNNNNPLYLHTDASQAACYLDLHASRMGVDLMTLNGGKMYGPKQSGVLFVRAGLELLPQINGGGQEMGLRSGTENVPAIIGLATALDVAQTNKKEESMRVAKLRDELQRLLLSEYDEMLVNGSQKKRLPNNLNMSIPGVDGERLVMTLDEMGLMASTGSACSANRGLSSHVLKALGLSSDAVHGSLRLTLGKQTDESDVKQAAKLVVAAVNEIRKYD